MKDKFMGVRMDIHLYAELEREAKSRGQTVASLVRTFVRDGLAGQTFESEKIARIEDRVEASLKVIEAMTGASLWSVAEIRARANVEKEGKSDTECEALVKDDYVNTVKEALRKGRQIAKVVLENKM